jgi:hypothetical protein
MDQLFTYKVTLEKVAHWTCTAKTPQQAISKIIKRLQQVGASRFKRADFDATLQPTHADTAESNTK